MDTPHKTYRFQTPEGQAAAQAARKRKGKARSQIKTVTVTGSFHGLPGGDSYAPVKPKEKHAQQERAIELTQQAVESVFSFMGKLIAIGSKILDERDKGVEISRTDASLVGEARAAAVKFMDKTVPDIIAEKDTDRNQRPVQIVFGAPIARMIEEPPPLEGIEEGEEKEDAACETPA